MGGNHQPHSGSTPLAPYVLLALATWLVGAWGAEERYLDGFKFSYELQKLANDVIGIGQMQDIIDRSDFLRKRIDGEAAVDEVAKKLSNQFSMTFGAVTRLKQYLESHYDRFDKSSKFYACCKYPDKKLEYNARLKAKVNNDDICYHVSADADRTHTLPLSDGLRRIFEENLSAMPTMKWQYYGTEEGVTTIFPANVNATCGTYPNDFDPRYRPWYVETATPVPKDIVIALDHSGSMRFGAMQIAREAAKTVVGTLNPKDRIGIVAFANEAYTPPGNTHSSCFSREMAFATPDNTDYLKRYLSDVRAFGGTNYKAALIKAFGLLSNSPLVAQDRRKRRKAILFLTDGKPRPVAADDILRTVSSLNARLNNEVMILTYGFGEEVDDEAQALLRNMSLQPFADESVGDVTPADFTLVASLDNLRFKLGSYYNLFSDVNHLKIPIITSPFEIYADREYMIAVSLPIYFPARTLRGVVAININMNDLVAQVAYFRHAESSYAFIMDASGRTMLHPLLSSDIGSSHVRETIFVDISAIEADSQTRSVIESMKSGGHGRKRVKTKMPKSRGNPHLDGVKANFVNSEYFWRPISGTNLSVCIVIMEKDRNLASRRPLSAEHFLYHRLDLQRDAQLCNYRQRISTIESSTVKLTSSAFQNVYQYNNKPDRPNMIRRYENYMKGGDVGSTIFREGVRDMVAITEGIDTFWRRRYKPSALRRFVGMYNGVLRFYPGGVLDKRFDHTKRPWYQKAIANPGVRTLTLPFVDALGDGIVVSLTQTVLEGRLSGTHSRDDMAIGVMGADFKLAHIQGSLRRLFHSCRDPQYRCFIVDTSGYLVFHDDFLSKPSQPVEYVHLAKKEPAIMRHLIEAGFMKRYGCTAFASKRIYYTWRLRMQYDSVLNIGGRPSYQLQSVPGSNVYIGIKRARSLHAARCTSCLSRVYDDQRTILRCSSRDDDVCQCPCYVYANFDYCNNQFKDIGDNHLACTPEPYNSTYVQPLSEVKADQLPNCYDVHCHAYAESDCQALEQCGWCYAKDDVDSHPACRDKRSCGPRPPTPPPVEPEPVSRDTTSLPQGMTTIVVSVATTSVAVVIIAAIGVVFALHRFRRPTSKTGVSGGPPDVTGQPLHPSPHAPHTPTRPAVSHEYRLEPTRRTVYRIDHPPPPPAASPRAATMATGATLTSHQDAIDRELGYQRLTKAEENEAHHQYLTISPT